MFQKLPNSLQTFGEISDYLITKIIKISNGRLIFFVTDKYFEYSIKGLERNKRSGIGTLKINITRREQPKPNQFEKYLRVSENKIQLVEFLANDWAHVTRFASEIGEREIFITYGRKCKRIRANNGFVLPEQVDQLSSNQEEADTKMFLCAQYAFNHGFTSCCIVTVDTYVGILGLYYSTFLQGTIYLQLGSKLKTRVINVSDCDIDEDIKKKSPSWSSCLDRL